jgi:iron complex outermembrane receptor protein
MKGGRITLILGAAAAGCGTVPVYATMDEEPVRLDPIEVVAERSEKSDSLLPTERGADGVFDGVSNPVEIPRAVSVVTPERMRLSGVDNFGELSEVSPGAERATYWGIAGSPELRGTHAGVYFNGMLRAWQRNEMPTSFGSCESLLVVRGPVPAQFELTPVGGYVNMVPKSPYFGEPHASISLSAASWDGYRGQIDVGGSTTAFDGMPAAWRVSVTGQKAGSYYDNVRNDYVSLYGTTIVQLDKRTTLTFGGEYYDFKSGEIPGWNRPTQNLVDNGRYVIGESVDVADAAWGGANRDLVTKSAATGVPNFSALVVPADVIADALKKGLVSQAAVDAMLNLSNADDRARAYGQPLPSSGKRDPFYNASGNASLDAALAKAYAGTSSTSGYRYTQAYFDKGGIVFTKKIDGSDILSDSRDRADSRDGLFFADWKREYDGGAVLTNKYFTERVATRKHSTYGFAVNSDQLVADDRLSLEVPVDALATRLTTGVEGRYTWAVVTQDFFAEPFSRRDISTGFVSDNSMLAAGSDVAPDGKNLWSPGRGANLECNLVQTGIFALADTRPTDRFRIYYGLRGEFASWHTHLANEVDRTTPALLASSKHLGSSFYCNGSVNPVYEFARGWYLYGAAQAGTALASGDAGTVVGRANFTKAKLVEGGVKASLLGDRLFLALDGYSWKQSRYSDLDARALPMRGVGAEAEATYVLGNFFFTGSFTFQRVRLLNDAIGYGVPAMTEEDWALTGGTLTATTDRALTKNPDRVYEGTPEHSAELMGVYKLPYGFGIAAGPHWRSSFYSSMDRSVKLPESVVWNALLYWRSGSWDASFRVRNLTNETYFYASDPVFSGNALVLKAEPRSYEFAVTYSF